MSFVPINFIAFGSVSAKSFISCSGVPFTIFKVDLTTPLISIAISDTVSITISLFISGQFDRWMDLELASEIITHYPDKTITIIHAKDKLIERNHEKAITYADKFLRKKGVKVVFGQRVVGKKKNLFITSNGNKIKSDLAFLCTGIKPNLIPIRPKNVPSFSIFRTFRLSISAS